MRLRKQSSDGYPDPRLNIHVCFVVYQLAPVGFVSPEIEWKELVNATALLCHDHVIAKLMADASPLRFQLLFFLLYHTVPCPIFTLHCMYHQKRSAFYLMMTTTRL
jgi:hypothetical protein